MRVFGRMFGHKPLISALAVLALGAAVCFSFVGCGGRAWAQQAVPLPVLAAQSPSSKAAISEEQKAPVIRFEYGGNVAQVPLDYNGEEDFVPVRVSSALPSLFLLNTASPLSALDEARLADLSVGGGVVIPAATAAEHVILGLPGLGIGMPLIQVRSFDALSRGIGVPVQGILGMDVLSRFVVEIDYDRLSVRLYDPSSYQYTGKGTSLPLTMQEGVPSILIRADIPGEKASQAQFVLDTAFAGTVEFRGKMAEPHRRLFSHLKMRPSTIPVEGTLEPPLEARINHLQVGPFGFDEAIADFAPPSSRPAPVAGNLGIVGNEILRRFKVILDVPHQRLIFETGHKFNDPFQADMSGITLAAEGVCLKTIRVVDVEEHSAAHGAGVEKGDVIVGVESEPAVQLKLADLRQLFRQPGAIVKLTLDRNGKMVTANLKLKRVI